MLSCGFNKTFYKPLKENVKTPPDAESIYLNYNESDSIHGLLYARENPIASIFLLHSNSGSLTGWGEIADLFYQAGYQVFAIDYPGFGNSTGKTNHENVFASTAVATAYFDEITQESNTKKLLMGFSLGGNLALKVGAENSELFDALVIEGAFESHRSIAMDQVPKFLRFLPYLFVKNHIDGSLLVSNWKKPLLVIHSKDDKAVSFEMAKTIYESATATENKELWAISGRHLAGISLNFERYLFKIKTLIETTE